ncbi:PilZ domain-containing protein [Falsochrobactrum sp. TDYN1]|uniref:PilZ domain-containing protein n=1 Tax=Falsochrobactrum tianjinense TaxID=2706015 RepID=A0A949UVS8_9HYPH|nr:PilZ domain-containing protein [Falsochrobactrum sp. TDYN1]MBV2144358.1 PilZ domain-containing protein [Falsochrobactrum sp. TDYN1]
MARHKPPKDRRTEERQRTRLRSGKIVSLDGRFIIECQFSDIAPHGAKLRTLEASGVPERFWLFDDFYVRALLARTIWRDGSELGVRFTTDPSVPLLDDERLRQLAGKYYSL